MNSDLEYLQGIIDPETKEESLGHFNIEEGEPAELTAFKRLEDFEEEFELSVYIDIQKELYESSDGVQGWFETRWMDMFTDAVWEQEFVGTPVTGFSELIGYASLYEDFGDFPDLFQLVNHTITHAAKSRNHSVADTLDWMLDVDMDSKENFHRTFNWIACIRSVYASDSVELFEKESVDDFADVQWDVNSIKSVQGELSYMYNHSEKSDLLCAAFHRKPTEGNFYAYLYTRVSEIPEGGRHKVNCLYSDYFVASLVFKFLISRDVASINWCKSYLKLCYAHMAKSRPFCFESEQDYQLSARYFFEAAESIKPVSESRFIKYVSRGFRTLEWQYPHEEFEKRRQVHDNAKFAAVRLSWKDGFNDLESVISETRKRHEIQQLGVDAEEHYEFGRNNFASRKIDEAYDKLESLENRISMSRFDSLQEKINGDYMET